MTKQEVNLKVLPADASNKELTVTLSDKNVATLKATANGVELDAKNGGTANLEVRSHYGEVERNIPVNVQSKTSMTVDGVEGTASRYVKDLPFENQVVVGELPYYRGQDKAYFSQVNTSKTGDIYRFTVTGVLDPYYRPISSTYGNPLKANTNYTMAFDYSTSSEVILRIRKIFGTTTNLFFEGSGRGCFTFNTGSTTQVLSIDPTRGKVATGGSSKIGDWIEVSNLILVEGSYDELPYYPAPEDYGVVHGQPNLLNGTSDEWETFSFSAWDVSSKQVSLSSIGLAVGDKIAFRCEYDNTQSSVKSKFKMVYRDKDFKSIRETSPTLIPTGAVGVSQGEDVVPEGAVYLYWAKAGKLDGTTQSTILARKHKLIKGSLAAMDDWTPSQADFEGLPNLLDGTMGTWQDFSFTGWHWSNVRLLLGEDFNIGDTFTLTSEIDNKASMPLYVRFAFATADNVVTYANSNQISAGSTGVATVTTTVPSNCAILYVHLVVKGDSTSTATGRVRKIKLVKGDKSQLGIWTPKSRTAYDKTLGIVPFTQPEYDTLQSADGIVRAETTIVGRGAEIEFKFDVIETLENKYPFLFEGLTTTAEKVEKYKTLSPSFTIPFTARGRGLLTSNGVESSRSVIHQKQAGGWIGVTTGTATNLTSSFTTYGLEGWGQQNYQKVLSDGTYVFRVCSRNNDLPNTGGSISDGITPAWVEVKDIELRVTIQLPEDPNAQPITITIPPS